MILYKLLVFYHTDLTEQDARQILAGDDEYERERMIGHIVRNARFEDIWKYITVQDIVDDWRVFANCLWYKLPTFLFLKDPDGKKGLAHVNCGPALC